MNLSQPNEELVSLSQLYLPSSDDEIQVDDLKSIHELSEIPDHFGEPIVTVAEEHIGNIMDDKIGPSDAEGYLPTISKVEQSGKEFKRKIASDSEIQTMSGKGEADRETNLQTYTELKQSGKAIINDLRMKSAPEGAILTVQSYVDATETRRSTNVIGKIETTTDSDKVVSGFKTASGKTITVPKKALDEAERKMSSSHPDEESFSLSKLFLSSRANDRNSVENEKPVLDALDQPGPSSLGLTVFVATNADFGGHRSDKSSLSLAVNKSTSTKAIYELQPQTDATTAAIPTEITAKCEANAPRPTLVMVNKINRPAYYLPEKKYFISKAAFDKRTKEEKESTEYVKAKSFFGINVNDGGTIKVVILDAIEQFEFVEGYLYKLVSFECKKKDEMWSTKDSSVIKLQVSPCQLPARECFSASKISSVANTDSKVVDFVGKVIDIGEYAIGNGQNVTFEDAEGEILKVKFQYGVIGEGVDSVILPGQIIAIVGLYVRGPIFRRIGLVFTTEYSEFYVDHPMPSHLVSKFELQLASMDLNMASEGSSGTEVCEKQRKTYKRSISPFDDSKHNKRFHPST